MTIILLLIIILLCSAIAYAHRKHADVLDELRGAIARLYNKIDGSAPK